MAQQLSFPCLPCGVRRHGCDINAAQPCTKCSEDAKLRPYCTAAWQLGPTLNSALGAAAGVDLTSRLSYKGRPLPDHAGGSWVRVYIGTLTTGNAEQRVALKVPGGGQSPRDPAWTKALLRASREAFFWSKLDHPNIVKYMGLANWDTLLQAARETPQDINTFTGAQMNSFPPGGHICLVAPWLEGGDVLSFLKDDARVTLTEMILDILAGLQHLHSRQVIHCDLKPNNILVDTRGPGRPRACLNDFDLSYPSNDDDIASQTSTTTGDGNPRYMALERVVLNPWGVPRRHSVDARTVQADIFELMRTLYHIMSGEPPFGTSVGDMELIGWLSQYKVPAKPAAGINDATYNKMLDAWKAPEDRPSLDNIEAFFQAGEHVPGRIATGKAPPRT